MNKKLLLFGLLFLVLAAAAVVQRWPYISVPTLKLLVNNNPAANFEAGLTGELRLDDSGTFRSTNPSVQQVLVVHFPDGGARALSFPPHGTRTYNITGRITTYTDVQYFGLVTKTFEQYSLTDEESDAITSGAKTLAEVEKEIRNQTFHSSWKAE